MNALAPSPIAALRAVADPSRLRLLRLLDLEELSVGELAEVTGLPQSGVSRHLAALRASGLLAERSEGVRTYVRLAPAAPESIASILAAVLATVRSDGFGHADDVVRLDRVRRAREADKESLFDELAADWDAL